MAVKEKINKVNETFIRVGFRDIDAKNRINLGQKILRLISMLVKAKTKGFDIFYGENGDILLRPMVTIPATEIWVYENKTVINKIRKGLADAKKGRTEKIEDLDQFFEDL